MSFFARPDLSDIQFRQISGSTLTMSGTTDFSGVLKSKGIEIDATTGITTPIGSVLTFNGTKITLIQSASGGTGVYLGNSPTTITLGGISSGTTLTGKTLSLILQELLVPTLNPTLTPPSSTFSVPLTNPYEIGSVISVTGTTVLNKGCINPQYTSASPYRSCGVISHNYIDFTGGTCHCYGANLTCTYSMSYKVQQGAAIAYGSISYCAGVQPKDSTGANYSTPLASGTTTPLPAIICGIYPYFYGIVASSGHSAGVCRPTPATICNCIVASEISRTGVCVLDSTGTIFINFNSNSDDYIWFAVPSGSTSKTCWCVNALNNGAIGGAVSAGGNLFPAKASVNSVATACWSGQTYNVYVSNYQSAVSTLMAIS